MMHVLGEEAGGADQVPGMPTPVSAMRADDHHPVGHRDLLPQAAHAAHVLLVGDRMDHRAGAKEQAAP
jgi:hypothetical protein